MRVAHIKLLRRSMIGIIVIVLLAVAYNYLHTWRNRARVITQAAEVLSSDMMRSADSIEYSTYENGRVRFKIRAERLLETRAGKNLLQGVEGSDRNPDGSIGNQIRSQRAEYDADHKMADFSGNVQLDIGSDVRIRTDSLHYDLNANIGMTDAPIQFASKEAQGTARGVVYNQPKKTIELKGNLDFTITRAPSTQNDSHQTEHIRARSSRGFFSKDERLLRFMGDAHLDSESASLSGELIEARFSEDQKHLTSLVCEGNVAYQSSQDALGPRTLQGDRMVFGIDQDSGSLQRIDVSGRAAFSSKSPEGDQELRGSTIHMELNTSNGQPSQIQSQGGVELRMKRPAEETLVTGESLETLFAPDSAVLQAIHVHEHARMLTIRPQEAARDELSAEDVRLSFREVEGRSALSELKAETSVQLNSTPPKTNETSPSAATRSLAANALTMTYSESGDNFESGRATGNVVLIGIPLGEAGRPEIRRLTADVVEFHFFAGSNRLRDFRGENRVRVYYLKPADPTTESPPQEFHTSSSHIEAAFRETDGAAQQVSQWGDFQYQDGARTASSGRGDYDAQKEILYLRDTPRIADNSGTTSGDIIQYDRRQKILTVQNHVRSVLKAREGSQVTPFASTSGSASATVITADGMQYW
ncbi:MAG TPA: LPS export ABC transporter periplasmic protein LptC, partial [Acidobacteriota bacterium]|nr:LPS export ABC transporter periplasmic protein LptC [Acidobacteriota bacterium]